MIVMSDPVLAAIIAAIVSTFAAIVTLISARWQMRGKLLELDNLGKQLNAEAEALRQTVMRDVLAKRMNAYAALWRVFITYERNWLLEGKPFDGKWAKTFLEALNKCNADHGVFFSEEVYKPFFEYRNRVMALASRAASGAPISREDIDGLVAVSSTGVNDMKSLATAMKDDLGSYTRVVIRTA